MVFLLCRSHKINWGDFVLSINDKYVMIESYKSVIFLSSEMIIIQLKHKILKICGLNLCVEYYTSEEMRIIGDINEINFQ